MNIFDKLQKIDRRILYVVLALVVAGPLLIRPSRHPSVVMTEVKDAYAVIDKVPKDQLVLISSIWGPGTMAENGPQTEVLMRHMFIKGTKFAVISWDQAGAELTYQIGNRLGKELNKTYGVDWIHLGYRVLNPPQAVIRGLAENFPKVIRYDREQVPLDKFPITRGVQGQQQIGAVVEITPSPTVELWIAYFTGPYHKPLLYCPTAVMAAEAYPYLDSGQISGMLNGVIGTVQYETLIGLGESQTDAAAYAWGLSAAHIYIILLIVLGNVAYVLSRRRSSGSGR